MEKNNDLTVTILAGGLGKRMKSELPKVLHCVNGVPMLVMIIRQCLIINPKKILVVVGKYKPIIESTLHKFGILDKINFAIQDEPLGTGHAILCTLDQLTQEGINVILNGDTPLLTADTILKIIQTFRKNSSKLQITSINNPNPTGSGRIILDKDGNFINIVEEKDCTDIQKLINLVNVGIYTAKNSILKRYIPLIENNNAQKEYYLTDIVKIYLKTETDSVGLIKLDKSKLGEIINVNTKEQLLNLKI